MRTATLRSGTLRSIGGTPVGEFLLIPFGPVNVDRPISGRDYTFTRQHGRQAVAWFGRQQRKLAIDYEHQTLAGVGAHPEGLAPAAGWIGRLEVRADGLWAADVEWTERARQLIASGEYRYFSPVIYWSDEKYTELTGLGPVALTNDPATAGVQPLAARRATERSTEMTVMVCSARALPVVGGKSDFVPSEEAQVPELTDEQLERVEQAAMRFRGALKEVAEAINVWNPNLGEMGKLMEYVREDKEVVKLFRLFAQELKEARERELGAAVTGSAGAGTAADRTAVILAAKRTYAAECANLTTRMIATERSWVHTTLRDAGHAPLTDAEVARHGIDDGGSRPAPRTSSGKPPRDRTALIVAAKDAYRVERANPAVRMIASEKAWVHTILRDAGLGPLTGEEIRQHHISDRL
jgi:hypothetical protein